MALLTLPQAEQTACFLRQRHIVRTTRNCALPLIMRA
jgi:hypothetical protein